MDFDIDKINSEINFDDNFIGYNKNDITQEESFIQLDSDRMNEVKQKFNNACKSIDFN